MNWFKKKKEYAEDSTIISISFFVLSVSFLIVILLLPLDINIILSYIEKNIWNIFSAIGSVSTAVVAAVLSYIEKNIWNIFSAFGSIATAVVAAVTVYMQFFKKFKNYDITIEGIKSFLSETDSKEVNLWCYSVKNNTSEKSVWKELPYLVILYSQFSKIDNHKIQIKNTTFYDSRDLASINMPTFFPNTEIMTNFMGIYLDWHTEISLILPELKKYYKEIKKNNECETVGLTIKTSNI